MSPCSKTRRERAAEIEPTLAESGVDSDLNCYHERPTPLSFTSVRIRGVELTRQNKNFIPSGKPDYRAFREERERKV